VLDSHAFAVVSFAGGNSVPVVGFFESSIQLVPDGTLLFHLALIVGMVALLNATLLKPINRILEERERRTSGRLSEAAATQSITDEKLRDYEQRLRRARAEGYAMMEKERTALNKERERKVSDVRAEMARSLSQEHVKLQQEVAAVKDTLEADAQSVALRISSQILKRELPGEPVA